MWIKDGQVVNGTYMGFPVEGLVVESRVKYGGKIQYTLDLLTPIQLPWRSEQTVRVLLDHDEIV